MLLLHRNCCIRSALLLQKLLVLALLAGANLSKTSHLGEQGHNDTVQLNSESASCNQLEDDMVLLQQFVNVAGRRDRRLVEPQEVTIAEQTGNDDLALPNTMPEQTGEWRQTSSDDLPPVFSTEATQSYALLPDARVAAVQTGDDALTPAHIAAKQIGDNAFTPANSPLNLLLYNEVVFEVSRQNNTAQHKSKMVLALIEGFFLPACCGVDRCYMGQPLLGILKGISLGGFFVWYVIDFVAIFINMCEKKDSIDTLGYVADFGNDQITTALILTIAFLFAHCCTFCGCCAGAHGIIRGHNLTPVPGTDEVLNVEQHDEVHANYKTISGTDGVIVGNHNHIEGGFHQIVGNFNVIEGKGCYVKGDGNLVNGINNQIEGRGNDVSGMSNVVSGAHNKVTGANPRCTESAPFKQGEFDKLQAMRSVNFRETSKVAEEK